MAIVEDVGGRPSPDGLIGLLRGFLPHSGMRGVDGLAKFRDPLARQVEPGMDAPHSSPRVRGRASAGTCPRIRTARSAPGERPPGRRRSRPIRWFPFSRASQRVGSYPAHGTRRKAAAICPTGRGFRGPAWPIGGFSVGRSTRTPNGNWRLDAIERANRAHRRYPRNQAVRNDVLRQAEQGPEPFHLLLPGIPVMAISPLHSTGFPCRG